MAPRGSDVFLPVGLATCPGWKTPLPVGLLIVTLPKATVPSLPSNSSPAPVVFAGQLVFQLGLEEAEAQEGLIAMAHKDSMLVLDRDPELAGERGVALTRLLALFGKEDAVRTLQAG